MQNQSKTWMFLKINKSRRNKNIGETRKEKLYRVTFKHVS